LKGLAFFVFLFAFGVLCQAQEPTPPRRSGNAQPRIVPKDTVKIPLDTLKMPQDTLKAPVDSLLHKTGTDTSRVARKAKASDDIATTINYHAKDSIFFDLTTKNLTLYSESHVDYGEIVLEAERTQVNWAKRTVLSDFVLDSAGRKVGKPVFREGQDTYVTDQILYNFRTRKAQITGVVTEQDGAIMHGTRVKKDDNNDMYIIHAKYTTCNLEHPHFFIESEKLKAIPGNKVVSGPFQLKFRDVPTPLWFPFGMFPQPKKKTSGIIVPVYGEEQRRGFFLRDGGYYWAVSDYTDLRVTGDLYSKGGHALGVTNNYYKRYSFRGGVGLDYNKFVAEDPANPFEQMSYWVRWNHTPESFGNSRFSASVNAGSSSYNQLNNLVVNDFQRSITSQFNSSISYSTRFTNTPFSMTTNLRHTQNVATGLVTLTLPELTVNMNRIYPFKDVGSSKSPLAKLNLSHTLNMKSELTNAPRSGLGGLQIANANSDASDTLAFNLRNWAKIQERSRIGARHQVPISTSLTVLKYLTVSPSFTYEEFWYTRELKFTDYDLDAGGIRVDTVNGFSRAGSWRSGASVTTRLYGTYNLGWKKIQAIRHVITPTVGFSYNPDFGSEKFGVYKNVVVDSLGRERRLSKYEGFIFGSPSGAESKSLNLSINNNMEMKVLNKKDTTGISYKKVKMFDNLSASSNYNFAADSFKLSNISWNARTSFFNNALSVNVNGTFDPYMYLFIGETELRGGTRMVQQRRLDRYAWNNGRGLGQLSNLTTSLNLNLQGKSKSKMQNMATQPMGGRRDSFGQTLPDEEGDLTEQAREIQRIQANPDLYVDFNVPWTLRSSYTVTRSKVGFQEVNIRQSMQFNGSLGLTEKTQITFNSGYDFERKEFTTTQIGVFRDLHCWTLNFSWVPFGTFQSYFLTIRVKSPILQDLKVEKRRSFFDSFSGPGGGFGGF
jgi:hypothetical protein